MPFGNHLLGFGNCLCRVEALGTGVRAIHDRVATIETESIFQLVQTLTGHLVTAIGKPAVSLEEDGRAQKLVAVPPIRRATGRAARTEDAFVQPIEFRPVFRRLQPFFARRLWRDGLQPRLDRRILRIKMGEVRDKVLDDFHMRQRRNRDFGFAIFNRGGAGEAIFTVDIH